MANVAVWPGKRQDLRMLERAINRDCICPDDPAACSAPHSLLTDQKSLNRLAFVISIRKRLIAEEQHP